MIETCRNRVNKREFRNRGEVGRDRKTGGVEKGKRKKSEAMKYVRLTDSYLVDRALATSDFFTLSPDHSTYCLKAPAR